MDLPFHHIEARAIAVCSQCSAFPPACFLHQSSSIRGSVFRCQLVIPSYQGFKQPISAPWSHLCLSEEAEGNRCALLMSSSDCFARMKDQAPCPKPFPTDSVISLRPIPPPSPTCMQALTSCGERHSRIVYAVARCWSISTLRQFVLAPI